jgi:hypothetical protein
MGFSRSLFFAQQANQFQMSQVPCLLSSSIFNDQSLPCVLDPSKPDLTKIYVYVDNLGILSLSLINVITGMTEFTAHFTGKGLRIHENSVGTGIREVLGVHLDCERHSTRPPYTLGGLYAESLHATHASMASPVP